MAFCLKASTAVAATVKVHLIRLLCKRFQRDQTANKTHARIEIEEKRRGEKKQQ